MNGECKYKLDGKDTDGTKWYNCTTHNELAPSKDAPCAGYEEIRYVEPPQQYTAMTVPKDPDPFTGKTSREVTGYYYKHEGPLFAFNEGQKDQTKHYIMATGFADWNMERPVDMHEIDITTLRKAK